jgi:hypothetical protein
MKRHIVLIALSAAVSLLLAPRAHADEITMTLTQDGSVLPGGSVDFTASFTNNTNSAVFINGDNFSVGFPLTLDDTNFLNYFVFSLSAPISIGPMGTLNGIDVFSITVDPTAMAGTYGGNFFSITGGADSSASNLLTTTDFSVVVSSAVITPEPATLLLLGASLTVLGLLRKRTNFSR